MVLFTDCFICNKHSETNTNFVLEFNILHQTSEAQEIFLPRVIQTQEQKRMSLESTFTVEAYKLASFIFSDKVSHFLCGDA